MIFPIYFPVFNDKIVIKVWDKVKIYVLILYFKYSLKTKQIRELFQQTHL